MYSDGDAGPSGGADPSVPTGAALCIKTGYFEGLEIPMDRVRIVIGRGRSADVVIAEPTISRAHAAVGYDGAGFYVEDLGSTNGTRVNGEPTQRRVLTSGDDVQMGKLVVGVMLAP